MWRSRCSKLELVIPWLLLQKPSRCIIFTGSHKLVRILRIAAEALKVFVSGFLVRFRASWFRSGFALVEVVRFWGSGILFAGRGF